MTYEVGRGQQRTESFLQIRESFEVEFFRAIGEIVCAVRQNHRIRSFKMRVPWPHQLYYINQSCSDNCLQMKRSEVVGYL